MDKGFFPNSIIINITSDRPLQFDLAGKNEGDAATKIGILHLPAKYKSAQIIDGQHRLLGYAGTDYATSHTIPVVAFENLTADMQIKLFMQINQNQKKVDKSLQNTLNAKIYGESDILEERIRGMRLKMAEDLANDNNSWLEGFVSSGEDEAKITSNAIDNALNMDIFLGVIPFIKTREFVFRQHASLCRLCNLIETLFPVLSGRYAFQHIPVFHVFLNPSFL